jgi:DNA uptake protein ComE-like DNA-binding protein
MAEPALPSHPKPSLIARGEQALLLLLALAVVAGVAYRAARYYRLGAEPLEVVPPSDGPTYRVNVNTADWVTLALVPGLGEALSKRIVETRQARRPGGCFASLDDLKAVPGIWVILALVPGLGEALSKGIVAARNARPGGRFDSLDDLKAVPGISDKLLAKLRPYLVLAPSDAGAEPVEMVEPLPPGGRPATAPAPASPR